MQLPFRRPRGFDPDLAAEANGPRRPGLILVAVAGALAVALVAAGVTLSFRSYQDEKSTRTDEIASEAAVVAARFDQFFEERFENLDTIGHMPVVQGGDRAVIKGFFERLVAAGSSFTGGLSLIGTDGHLILLSGFPLSDEPVDLSDRDYVRAVLATNQPAFGDAIIGRVSGDPLLTFAVPVRDASGATISVLAGTIRIDLPEGGLARIGASLGNAVIVDGSGQILVDRGVVQAPTAASPAFLAATSGATASESVPAPDGSGSWVGGFAPIGTSNWRAVVLHDRSDAFGDARRSLLLELGTFGLIGLGGVSSTVWAARRMNRNAAAEHAESEGVRAQEEFLREFADALPVIAGTLDAAGKTSFANRALRATGPPDLAEIIHPDDVALLPPAAATDAEVSVELRLRTRGPADEYRWHRARFVRAMEMGDVRWFFAAADIDDEKRLELGLQRDIQQRDEFLGLVSHELRTPLTMMIGNADTLARHFKKDLPPIAIESISEIETNARRLQRLLENMLALSQANAQDAAPNLEPQILGRLVERTLRDFRIRFPAASPVIDLPDGLPIVNANATFVDQVLWNLLSNAAKYGGAEGKILLDARQVGGFVEVAVTDHGKGLPDDELERIFDPHFRSRANRSRATGLGLGLSVCRRLVELQGGEINAEPGAEGGMRFSFTLPVLEA